MPDGIRAERWIDERWQDLSRPWELTFRRDHPPALYADGRAIEGIWRVTNAGRLIAQSGPVTTEKEAPSP